MRSIRVALLVLLFASPAGTASAESSCEMGVDGGTCHLTCSLSTTNLIAYVQGVNALVAIDCPDPYYYSSSRVSCYTLAADCNALGTVPFLRSEDCTCTAGKAIEALPSEIAAAGCGCYGSPY